MQRGRFISFEGGEGTGKSTQVRLLADRLGAEGLRVVTTREPGGSPVAEKLRDFLLAGGAERLGPAAEAILFYAARADHLETLIVPALARGDWVVCDRFADSTRAYQGAGGGTDGAVLRSLERIVVGENRPDLTIVLDMAVEDGLARAAARRGGALQDRFEGEGAAFHERLRTAFLAIAREQPERCVVVPAAGAAEAVHALVWQAVGERLKLPVTVP